MSGTTVCFIVQADNFDQARFSCESQIQDSIKDFYVESALDLDTDNAKVFYKRDGLLCTCKEQLVAFVKSRMKTPERVMRDIRRELDSTNYLSTMFYNIQQLCEIGKNNMSQEDIDNWDIENEEFNPWVTTQFSVTNLTVCTEGDKLFAVFVNVE